MSEISNRSHDNKSHDDHAGAQNWEGHLVPGQALPNVPNFGGVNKAMSKKLHQEATNPTKDTTATSSITDANREEDAKAAGMHRATLSPTQYDRATPGDPQIAGTKGFMVSMPPAGATGTGNPFFNGNPMAAFFRATFNIIQLEKFITQVATKLATSEINLIQETAKAEAGAIMQAGQAEYNAEMKQAWISGITAGIAFASVGVTGGMFLKSKMAQGLVKKETEKAVTQAESDVNKVETTMNDTLGTVRARNLRIQQLQNAGKPATQVEQHAQEELEVSLDEGQQAANRASQTRVTTRIQAEQEQSMVEKDARFKSLGEKPLVPPKAPDKQAAKYYDSQGKFKQDEFDKDTHQYELDKHQYNHERSQWISQQKKYQELFGPTTNRKNPDAMKPEERDAEIAEHQAALPAEKQSFLNQQKRYDKYNTNYVQLRNNHEMQKARDPVELGSMMHNDPLYMMWQTAAGPQGLFSSALQAAGHVYAAIGAQQKAYWNSYQKYLEMDLQIDYKGLDVDMEMRSSAQKTVDEVCQTLKQQSDSELNMRMAA